MGCCTNFRHFAELTGFADLFETQPELFFVGPPEPSNVVAGDGRRAGQKPPIVRFCENSLPAPAHLATALLSMPWFRFSEKLQIAQAMRSLSRENVEQDEPFSVWLDRHGQNETVQRRFWHLVLVSALSETLDRISLKHARKVFVGGFLKHRTGWRVAIPTCPLYTIYETRLSDWLTRHSVDVRLKAGVSGLETGVDGKVARVVLRSGEAVDGDHFILSVPQNLVTSLLPGSLVSEPSLSGISRLEAAPIASVHLWFDRPLTDLPHAVLLDRLSQWVFNRGERDGRAYLQVVISAAGDLRERSAAEVVEQVRGELFEAFGLISGEQHSRPQLVHSRLITEHRAVFAPVPGVDDLRPVQQSPIANLQFAGDWTLTGWPGTMEGAVRSGYLAAENVLQQLEMPATFVQSDLPASRLFRWLYQ